MQKNLGSTSKNTTFYLMITFLNLALIILGLGYVTTSVYSSQICGPFNSSIYLTPYEYIFRLRDELLQISGLSLVIAIVFSPGLLAFILFLLVYVLFIKCHIVKDMFLKMSQRFQIYGPSQ